MNTIEGHLINSTSPHETQYLRHSFGLETYCKVGLNQDIMVLMKIKVTQKI